ERLVQRAAGPLGCAEQSAVEPLFPAPDDLRARALVDASDDEIDRIELSEGARTPTLVIARDADGEFRFTAGGEGPVDAGSLAELTQALRTTRVAAFVGSTDAGAQG